MQLTVEGGAGFGVSLFIFSRKVHDHKVRFDIDRRGLIDFLGNTPGIFLVVKALDIGHVEGIEHLALN